MHKRETMSCAGHILFCVTRYILCEAFDGGEGALRGYSPAEGVAAYFYVGTFHEKSYDIFMERPTKNSRVGGDIPRH